MPAAFIGHGSPMNALELNRYTSAWQAFGRSAPRPRAILVISAHWYINATAVTAMAVPRTIHDFYGFPAELFDVQYPAPGLPELADEIADVVEPTWVGADIDSWGIDHGTWSVLVHAFPDASVPVVQLAVNAYKPLEYHLELGAKLAALRQRGVLILGSGNVVHNLAAMDPALGDGAFDWAQRFDDEAWAQLMNDPADAAGLRDHADYAAAVPTPDHFLPLLYFAGLAAENGGGVDVLTEGCAYGSLSMTSYTLGLGSVDAPTDDRDAAAPAAGVPVDETNI
ncbi:4,5-DOPA dioxygenase extradiol [Mycobacterium sp. EPa45]|uniref:4,5-DOPA-extradiol-dioxygenase n=1 Tax=Mycobacterium sp. EPa45 TaxID=1545728 RepID=UPI0006425508|nr:4,5-DOPA dioxygenase extradiol [Mycobacterium sp. EPa45]AKK30400.1 extradiol ring-cleavage dioxygenase [Mycobacterium sp. EPa45]